MRVHKLIIRNRNCAFANYSIRVYFKDRYVVFVIGHYAVSGIVGKFIGDGNHAVAAVGVRIGAHFDGVDDVPLLYFDAHV